MERATIKTYIDQCNGSGLPWVADCIENLAAEVERLQFKLQRSEMECVCVKREVAASQARGQQLRDRIHSQLERFYASESGCIDDAVLSDALNAPQDTSALEALIARAGEVMRERCSLSVLLEHGGPEDECRPALEECSEAIRALPGVTLEDLQK